MYTTRFHGVKNLHYAMSLAKTIYLHSERYAENSCCTTNPLPLLLKNSYLKYSENSTLECLNAQHISSVIVHFLNDKQQVYVHVHSLMIAGDQGGQYCLSSH